MKTKKTKENKKNDSDEDFDILAFARFHGGLIIAFTGDGDPVFITQVSVKCILLNI